MAVFTDYFFAVGPNNNQAVSNTLINPASTATLVSGYGGYTGTLGYTTNKSIAYYTKFSKF